MTSQPAEPVGRPFSQVYLRPTAALSNSKRFRIRLGALFTKWFPWGKAAGVLSHLRQRGLNVDSDWTPSLVEGFVQTCETADALDLITFVYEWLLVQPEELAANRRRRATEWCDRIRVIIEEESLGYRIDDACGVHPLVDTGFEMARVSVLAGLGDARYNATRKYLDAAFAALESQPPNLRAVVKSAFDAAENVFKLAASIDKALTSGNVTQCLLRVIDSHYSAADESQKAAAGKLAASFADWVDAGHKYRHAHQDSEPHEPEVEFAVAYMGGAMTYIRWLAAIDAARQQRTVGEP